MSRKLLSIVCFVVFFPILCPADNPDFKTVEGGALYLMRGLPNIEGTSVETHRAEFDIAADCEHVAKIMNEAEPAVHWYCSTSVPDIMMNCEISGFEIKAEPDVVAMIPEKLVFSIVMNRGLATGSVDLDLPMDFEYTESDKGYLLTNNYTYASGNSFTKAIYLMIIDSTSGEVEVRDIGGGANGNGTCIPVEK